MWQNGDAEKEFEYDYPNELQDTKHTSEHVRFIVIFCYTLMGKSDVPFLDIIYMWTKNPRVILTGETLW